MSQGKQPMFRGERKAGVISVTLGGVQLNPRYDLRQHSPTGFNWGYSGSGPAQLALAMVAAAVDDDDLAEDCYQDFKDGILATFRGDVWEFALQDVVRWAQDWQRRNATPTAV